jgi:beta-ribofuranosylaminobenzene 5'-phosphate synthase
MARPARWRMLLPGGWMVQLAHRTMLAQPAAPESACAACCALDRLGISPMQTALRSVAVRSPARLHLGFLDLNGSRGRRFGSVGLTLDALGVSLIAERAAALSVSGPQAARAERFARALLQHHRLPETCRIAIHEAIPEHVGLGSGTQLAIAVGVGLTRLYGLDIQVREVAALYDRGRRSGIGVGAFEQGGFLVDGGRGARDELPRIVSRAEFPPQWRMLLVFDRTLQGLHGEQELAAFRALPDFPGSVSAQLCRLMLLQGLPALLEGDAEDFGLAIGELQRVIGDYFAPAQGGRFASPRVAEVLGWLERQGLAGVGQSSWGPTGFAVVGNEYRALELAQQAQARWGTAGPLQFMVCSGRNHGGEVTGGEVAVAEATRAAAG